MFNFKKIFFNFWGKKDEYKSNILNSLFNRVNVFITKTIETVVSTDVGLTTENAVYRIVDNGAEGRFEGNENQLAFLDEGIWRLVEPVEGVQFYDKSLGRFIYYNGTEWVGIGAATCKPHHDQLPGYEPMAHILWNIAGDVKIAPERVPVRAVEQYFCRIHHDDLLDFDERKHVLWQDSGNEKIAYDRVQRDKGLVEMGEPTGMTNREDATLTWDDATRTLSISSNSWYDWFYKGKFYQRDSDSLQIADTEGNHYICYVEDVLTDVLIDSHTALSTVLKDYALVFAVYWNSTDGEAIIKAEERHWLNKGFHHWAHETQGAQYYNGGEISGYTLLTDSNAGISFDLTDVEFYDEDIDIDIEDGIATVDYEQVLTGDAEIPVLYRDDVTGAWTQSAASTLPYLTAGGGNLAYNNNDGDGTWSQVELSNNNFVLYTLIATNDKEYPIKMLQGQAEYTTANLANSGARSELIDFGDFPSAEIIFLYRFVMKTSSGLGGDKNARIEELYDLRGMNTKNFKFLIGNARQIT